jgi:hypothetical protein
MVVSSWKDDWYDDIFAECQDADMKSAVKTQFPKGDDKTNIVLAAQDDVRTSMRLRRPPGVRR